MINRVCVVCLFSEVFLLSKFFAGCKIPYCGPVRLAKGEGGWSRVIFLSIPTFILLG